jgi:hypothetical protein
MEQRPRPRVHTRQRQALAPRCPRARARALGLGASAFALVLGLRLLFGTSTAAAQSAALSVTVTDGADVAEPGRGLTLQILARNAGPADAVGAQLKGALAVTPAEAAGELTVFWRCSTAAPDPSIPMPPVPEVGRDNVATTATVPVDGVLSCLVFVEVPRTGVSSLRYTAQLVPPAALTDPDPQDNQAVDVTTIRPSADLQLTVRGLPSAPISGQVLSFAVGVRNVGPSPATNVRLDIDKPPGAHIDQPPTGPGWSCTDLVLRFRCTRPELPLFQISELLLSLLPDAAAASIALGAGGAADETDPVPGDNAAVTELPIEWRDGKARSPTFSGGGFGCAVAPGRHAPGGGGLGSLILTMTLVGWALPRRRNNQQRKRGLPCDETF